MWEAVNFIKIKQLKNNGLGGRSLRTSDDAIGNLVPVASGEELGLDGRGEAALGCGKIIGIDFDSREG